MNTLTISKDIIVCTLYASANFAAALLFFRSMSVTDPASAIPLHFRRKLSETRQNQRVVVRAGLLASAFRASMCPPAHFAGGQLAMIR